MNVAANSLRSVWFAFGTFIALVILAFGLASRQTADPNAPVSLLIGAALGLAFERGRFCFFCIFREAFEEQKTRQMLSIVTAIAVGAVGYALMFGLYLPNPKGEGLPPAAHISPVSLPLILGAFAFGIGMVLSGACISGHLYRIGQGYLRAVPALVGSLVGFGLGFFTWNTLYLEQVSESPVLWLPRWFGYSASLLLTLVVLVFVGWLLVRWDRTTDDASTTSTTARVRTAADLGDLLLVRRWSPIATGAIVGGIGIAAYLRTTPLGVTSQLSTISRSVLDSRNALPEVLHGIDMMRGCVAIVTSTITNNGSAGSVLTMPIINQPQVAILSTDAIVRKPVVVTANDGSESIAIHPVGNLAMAWDHRAFDGAYAARFLSRIKEILETHDWSAEI
ncbi:MAG: hypothetical protein RIR87_481 [Actinomycetota bacterium]